MIRSDGRQSDEIRDVNIRTGIQEFAEGSTLIEIGKTSVLCAVSIQEGVPQFLRGRNQGWVTAEYNMLPRSTLTRNSREGRTGGPRGRTHEIQRLIGRSLRGAVDLSKLGERTFILDCDVLQADGGTRTAAITGSYVALYQAIKKNGLAPLDKPSPILGAVAAISVGVIDGRTFLDLNYEEDARASSDFNVVMTERGRFLEIQGTAEEGNFARDTIGKVLDLAEVGIAKLFKSQEEIIAKF